MIAAKVYCTSPIIDLIEHLIDIYVDGQLSRTTASRLTSTCVSVTSSLRSPPPQIVCSADRARPITNDSAKRVQDLRVIKHDLYSPFCNAF